MSLGRARLCEEKGKVWFRITKKTLLRNFLFLLLLLRFKSQATVRQICSSLSLSLSLSRRKVRFPMKNWCCKSGPFGQQEVLRFGLIKNISTRSWMNGRKGAKIPKSEKTGMRCISTTQMYTYDILCIGNDISSEEINQAISCFN